MSEEFFPDKECSEQEIVVDQEMVLRKPTLAQVCALYSLAAIFLIYVGFRLQKDSVYLGLLVTEFILILAPSLILLYIYKYDFKKVLRVNKISIKNTFIIMSIMAFALPAVSILNALNLMIIKGLFGKIILPDVPMAGGQYGLLISILVIAGSAGICEEVMFRGIILRGFERFGIVKAILMTAFLFGLVHLDFQKLLGTFLLGALIGFIVYRTNSLFAGMIAHFTNNSVAVLLSFGLSKMQEISKTSGIENAQGAGSMEDAQKAISSLMNIPTVQLVIVLAFYGIIALFFIAALVGLIIVLINNTSGTVEKVTKEKKRVSKKGFLWLVPGFVLVALVYLAEALKLGNMNGSLFISISKYLGIS